MQYLLLVYANEAGWTKLTPAEQEQGVAAYAAYTEALKKAGILVGSNRLQGTSSATRITMSESVSRAITAWNARRTTLDGAGDGPCIRRVFHQNAGPNATNGKMPSVRACHAPGGGTATPRTPGIAMVAQTARPAVRVMVSVDGVFMSSADGREENT